MSPQCHLFALDPQSLHEIANHPEAAIGGALLRGLPQCDLHEAWQSIDFLLRGSINASDGGESTLRSGGTPIAPDVEGSPRLLTPSDVAEFHGVLVPVTETVFYHRYSYPALVVSDIDSLHGGADEWDLGGEWSADASENWSLDEAEDYEFLSHCFEQLRNFIAESAANEWGVLVVLR